MSDYLNRFQAQTRSKADSELIRRWEWEARFHGEKNIKNQATSAKRTATSMQKACEQFSNVKPEYELAVKAAASALRSMAAELELLAAWAKDYRAFCVAEWKKEEAAELEALARDRWGHDDQALKFECDLFAELGTVEGQLTFANWCHAAGKHLDCKVEEISSNVEGLLQGPTDRMRAALTVKQGMDRRTANKWVGWRGQTTVICGWPDYGRGLILDNFADTTGALANVLGPTEFAPQGRGSAAVRSLLSAPYHALDLLSPQRDVGISVKSSDQVGTTATFGPRAITQLNTGIAPGQYSQKADGAVVLTFPCDGTTGTAYELRNETPNPVPGRDLNANPVGQPIIVSVRVGQLITISAGSMVKASDGSQVRLRTPIVRANDANFLVDPSRAILLPDSPLQPNTEYTVTVSGTNTTMKDFNNGNPISTGTNPAITANATGNFTKTFTFKTGS